jgi:hypothetical protein
MPTATTTITSGRLLQNTEVQTDDRKAKGEETAAAAGSKRRAKIRLGRPSVVSNAILRIDIILGHCLGRF